MLKKYLLFISLFAALSLMSSCGDKDEDLDPSTPTVTVADFSATIAENPIVGTVIGTINTSTSDNSELEFSWVFNAEDNLIGLSIEPSTGQLTISEISAFDYELNPILTGTGEVSIKGRSESRKSFKITITLTDVDDQVASKSIQQRLKNGETPFQIYQSDNATLDSLYGKSYVGGLIFYMNISDGTGLVVAPSDLSASLPWDFNPPLGGWLQTFDTLKTIGTGETNTKGIIADLGAGTYAAQACNDLELNSYSDWFLPSTDELNAIWKNLHNKGFGNFSTGLYWTSTEAAFSKNQAYHIDFTNPSVIFTTAAYKDELNKVRAVRKF